MSTAVEPVEPSRFPLHSACLRRTPNGLLIYHALTYLREHADGAVCRIPIVEGQNKGVLQRRVHEYAKRQGMQVETRTQDGWLYLRRMRVSTT